MTVRLLTGDCRTMLATLPCASVQLCVTSPPYFGLRDYGVDGQIGLESTVEAYVAQLIAVFREVRRVLRDDGVLFLNLGDSYASTAPGTRNGSGTGLQSKPGQIAFRPDYRNSEAAIKPKDLIGIPWRVAFALQQPWLTCRGCGTESHLSQWASFPNGRRICPACELSKGHDISESGWYLRSDIIWAKPNPMPESVRDRPTKAHEYIFLLTKSPRYFWDAEAVAEKAEFGEHHAKYQGTYTRHKIESMQENGAPNGTQYQEGLRRPAVNPLTRNIRSVWTIATSPFSAAHFATFPSALAERCIKAGSSEKGACDKCGAPWVRTTERESVPKDRPTGRGWSEAIQAQENWASGTPTHSGLSNSAYAAERTTGWRPTCPCYQHSIVPVRPCVVLDPFGGAGTVSLVAERLGRDSIYIDLSPEYAAMARKRITGDAPMFAAIELP